MSIKIIALSKQVLREDYHYYAEFLKEVVVGVSATGTSVVGSEGKLKNGLYFKAMDVSVEVPPDIGDKIWVVVPSTQMEEWLVEVEADERTQGIFAICPNGVPLRLNERGFCYQSIAPPEMFQALFATE